MTDSMLERVRKLLAKAEDPACTPQEAAALNDKAAELIAKYGVDRALLAASAPESDPVGDRVVAVLAPYALDKTTLLAAVARAMRCRTVRRKEFGPGGYFYNMHLFGFASDLERTELLFTSLLVQAAFGLAAEPVPGWESVAAFRRSWLAGFTHAVWHRLSEAERRAATAATSAGPSVAVVLLDRGQLVDRRVEEAYPRLRSSAPRRLMGSGHAGGYAAGERADIGMARVGVRSQRRLNGG